MDDHSCLQLVARLAQWRNGQTEPTALLIVDNFIAHKVAYRSHAQLRFFPPKCTAKAQPLDAGIIKCFKDAFKQHLFTSMFERIPTVTGVEDFEKGLTIFDAVDWAMEARKTSSVLLSLTVFTSVRWSKGGGVKASQKKLRKLLVQHILQLCRLCKNLEVR